MQKTTAVTHKRYGKKNPTKVGWSGGVKVFQDMDLGGIQEPRGRTRGRKRRRADGDECFQTSEKAAAVPGKH